MAMNRSSFYHRLIKSMLSSSSSFGIQQGGLLKRRCHSVVKDFGGVRICGDIDDSKGFSLIHPHLIPGLDGSWTDINTTSSEILASGMILLKNYITLRGQVGIVNTCEKLGGFYEPSGRYAKQLHMACYGRNWDPVTRYKKQCRSDGSEPPRIPYQLIHLAETIMKDAQALLPDQLPSMTPDVCLANFYSCDGRRTLHQDCDESSDSLERGLPVVSISVGDTAEFWYAHPNDKKKLRKVLLMSGDVLIFGGKSRLIFHKVKVLRTTAPFALLKEEVHLRPGRLNVTLKQF